MRNNYFIFACFLFLTTACGGGGGSTPQNPNVTPPTTTTPSTSTLYIGYYTEDRIADPNDPTPGVIYIYLPDSDTGFNGEFFFSYVGCLGSYDTGLVNGNKSGTMLAGTWSGDVDGTVSSGAFTATNVSPNRYTGTWTRDGGSQNFSFGNPPYVCGYTFAGNGDFTLYKILNGTIPIAVDLSNAFSPVFTFTPSASAAAFKIDVFDAACLASGAGISACTMWEDNVVDTGSGLPTMAIYGSGALASTSLVSGNSYVVSFISYDMQGSVLDFASNQFNVP